MNEVLVVKNLCKSFGSFHAVSDISFSLSQGEILGFLGQNGAGKTTTIQMLLGVLTPTSGKIEYFGRNFHLHKEELLESINFSSAYTNLPYNIKVKDALHFVSYFYALPNRALRVKEIVESFNLTQLLDSRVASLSAGEQTRLNLAKAFLNRPKVILLDEPTASLDPETAQMAREYIYKIKQQEKMSVVFTSHNMVEVEELCDRVIFIENGKITANDTPYNLSRKLDLSTVSLVLQNREDPGFKIVADKFQLTVAERGQELTMKLRESVVPNFMQALVANKVEFRGLTVRRASLEEYFFKEHRISSEAVNAS